jgi:RNA polymerase sigma-70 factor, ECF subfamily
MTVGPQNDGRDRELLERLAAGEQEALADMYDLHADALFGHALALTRNRADAEDLVQATFVKLAALGAESLAIRHVGRFLHHVLRSAAIDQMRRRAVRDDFAARPEPVYLPAGGLAPDVGLALDEALAQLPFAQREAVVLHLVEGLSFREVGRATGVTTFTAASRYRLAIIRLRRVLRVP